MIHPVLKQESLITADGSPPEVIGEINLRIKISKRTVTISVVLLADDAGLECWNESLYHGVCNYHKLTGTYSWRRRILNGTHMAKIVYRRLLSSFKAQTTLEIKV